MTPIDTVPCQFCGKPTMMTGTKKCDQCWETVRNLSLFLRTKAGRAFVRAELAEAESAEAESDSEKDSL